MHYQGSNQLAVCEHSPPSLSCPEFCAFFAFLLQQVACNKMRHNKLEPGTRCTDPESDVSLCFGLQFLVVLPWEQNRCQCASSSLYDPLGPGNNKSSKLKKTCCLKQSRLYFFNGLKRKIKKVIYCSLENKAIYWQITISGDGTHIKLWVYTLKVCLVSRAIWMYSTEMRACKIIGNGTGKQWNWQWSYLHHPGLM